MVDPWIGPVVRATIAAFVHTSVPLMVLEYAHLPPSTAAAVHFVLLVSTVTGIDGLSASPSWSSTPAAVES